MDTGKTPRRLATTYRKLEITAASVVCFASKGGRAQTSAQGGKQGLDGLTTAFVRPVSLVVYALSIVWLQFVSLVRMLRLMFPATYSSII